MRDTRSWVFQYVVPVLFVLVGMLVMRVRNIMKDYTYPAAHLYLINQLDLLAIYPHHIVYIIRRY